MVSDIRTYLASGRMSVRRLAPAEWAVLLRLRLAALDDAPSAFLVDEAAESAHSREDWMSRCGGSAWFVVSIGGCDVGIANLTSRPAPGEVAHIEGMWVVPDWRRRGVATLLVHCLEAQARHRGETVLGLWVFDSNPSARRLYERLGYAPLRPVPRRQGLRDRAGHAQDDRIEEELRKDLQATPAA